LALMLKDKVPKITKETKFLKRNLLLLLGQKLFIGAIVFFFTILAIIQVT